MTNLNFNKEGQSYVSDAFSGGKAIQISFPEEGTQVLFTESRLGSTLPWKKTGSRVIERTMILNIPEAGEGQEFRLNCFLESTSAVLVTESSGGGGSVGPNTVGSEEIVDDSVMMEDLNQSVKDTMVTGDDRVTQEELDGFSV